MRSVVAAAISSAATSQSARGAVYPLAPSAFAFCSSGLCAVGFLSPSSVDAARFVVESVDGGSEFLAFTLRSVA